MNIVFAVKLRHNNCHSTGINMINGIFDYAFPLNLVCILLINNILIVQVLCITFLYFGMFIHLV
jgi:hypothetical protein